MLDSNRPQTYTEHTKFKLVSIPFNVEGMTGLEKTHLSLGPVCEAKARNARLLQ
jgi:hypothetical protein